MMLSKVWPQFSKSRVMEEDCSGDSSSTRKVAKWLRRPNGPRCEVDRRSFSAQIQRLEHSEALFSQRIVDHFTHIVDDHCWAVLGVIGWPVRQLRRAWVAGARERDPRIADLIGEGHGVRASARHPRPNLHIVKSKWNFHRVRRLETPALYWSLPGEIVQIHGRFAQRGSPLGCDHCGSAVAVVAGDQKVDIGRRGARIELPVQFDHSWHVSA